MQGEEHGHQLLEAGGLAEYTIMPEALEDLVPND